MFSSSTILSETRLMILIGVMNCGSFYDGLLFFVLIPKCLTNRPCVVQ